MTIIVRSSQITVLEENMSARFRERVIQYLRDTVPHFVSSRNDEEISRFLACQEIKAREVGATTERQLVQWFYLAAAVSEDFDTIPEVNRFLRARKFTMSEKLDALLQSLADAAGNRKGGL